MRRLCKWCEGPMPPGCRCDAVYCSQSCRQAAWRFSKGMYAARRTQEPIRVAYADPPYPGTAKKYYADHPDFDGEVDHAELVEKLLSEYPDGWALSTSSKALPMVLKLCPNTVRIGVWFRGSRPNKTAREPQDAWEPVVYAGGRQVEPVAGAERRENALVYVSRPRLTDPKRVIGAKSAAFIWWMFSLLGLRPGDDFTDLFPGSDGVSRAWGLFNER